MSSKFGLIGTITYDVITFDSGQSFEGLGGVLYQAAVFCGLKRDVFLYTNLGEELAKDVKKIFKNWRTLRREGIRQVPGPGNRVHLHYPEKGERVEILKSVVPPLNPHQVLDDIHDLGILVMVVNSGFDIELSDWQKIVLDAKCPVWFDIHSLLLTRRLNTPRKYVPLSEWKEWIKGISFIQANEKEVASMLGKPDEVPSETEMLRFGKKALEFGAKAAFVTLGKEGVFVMAPEESRKIRSLEAKTAVDTTGCGDVFCGGTVVKLIEGKDVFSSASFGLELATKAVGVRGIEETYKMACDHWEMEKLSKIQ